VQSLNTQVQKMVKESKNFLNQLLTEYKKQMMVHLKLEHQRIQTKNLNNPRRKRNHHVVDLIKLK